MTSLEPPPLKVDCGSELTAAFAIVSSELSFAAVGLRSHRSHAQAGLALWVVDGGAMYAGRPDQWIAQGISRICFRNTTRDRKSKHRSYTGAQAVGCLVVTLRFDLSQGL